MVEVSYVMSLFYRLSKYLFIFVGATYPVLWIATRLSNIFMTMILGTKMLPLNSYFSTNICIPGFSCINDVVLGLVFGILIFALVCVIIAIFLEVVYPMWKNHYCSWISRHENKYDQRNIKYYYVWYLCRKLIIVLVITKWIMWTVVRIGYVWVGRVLNDNKVQESFVFFSWNICGGTDCFLLILYGSHAISVAVLICFWIAVFCFLIYQLGIIIYDAVKNDYQSWKKEETVTN